MNRHQQYATRRLIESVTSSYYTCCQTHSYSVEDMDATYDAHRTTAQILVAALKESYATDGILDRSIDTRKDNPMLRELAERLW